MSEAGICQGNCRTDQNGFTAAAAKNRLDGTDVPRAHTHDTACITSAFSSCIPEEHVHLLSWINDEHHAHMTMRDECTLSTEKSETQVN